MTPDRIYETKFIALNRDPKTLQDEIGRLGADGFRVAAKIGHTLVLQRGKPQHRPAACAYEALRDLTAGEFFRPTQADVDNFGAYLVSAAPPSTVNVYGLDETGELDTNTYGIDPVHEEAHVGNATAGMYSAGVVAGPYSLVGAGYGPRFLTTDRAAVEITGGNDPVGISRQIEPPSLSAYYATLASAEDDYERSLRAAKPSTRREIERANAPDPIKEVLSPVAGIPRDGGRFRGDLDTTDGHMRVWDSWTGDIIKISPDRDLGSTMVARALDAVFRTALKLGAEHERRFPSQDISDITGIKRNLDGHSMGYEATSDGGVPPLHVKQKPTRPDGPVTLAEVERALAIVLDDMGHRPDRSDIGVALRDFTGECPYPLEVLHAHHPKVG